MILTVYEFIVYDPNVRKEFTFKGYCFPTGEVMIPGEQTHDGFYEFYESLDAVTGHGQAEIRAYARTAQTVELTDEELAQSTLICAREFGEDAIPASLRHWLV